MPKIEINHTRQLDFTRIHYPKTRNASLDDEERVLEFKEEQNQGDLLPMGVNLDREDAPEQIQLVEGLVVTVPTNSLSTQIRQLQCLFKRFHPTAEMSDKEVQEEYNRFLQSRGFDLERPLETQLQSSGRIMYFPIGIDASGRLIVTKHRYFPMDLQYEILTSSEGPLLTEAQRKVIKHSRHTAIGLSVGSANVEAALLADITHFDLADPGRLHEDAEGRLGYFGFHPSFLDINKTVFSIYQILHLYPYAHIQAFPEGLTNDNRDVIFKPQHMSIESQQWGIWFINEEADNFVAGKVNSRIGAHSLPPNIQWHLTMMGDVGHRVTFFHEQPGDQPFHGMLAPLDPQGDVYGRGLAQERGQLPALFASVGGFTGIPNSLLQLMKESRVGTHPGATITRVPQSREATLLTAAIQSAVIRLAAAGEAIVPHHVFDLRTSLIEGGPDPIAVKQELRLQAQMNQRYFGTPTLAI